MNDDSDDDSESLADTNNSYGDTGTEFDNINEDNENIIDEEKQGFGFHVLPRNCPDCDYSGNGKCSNCHGSGNEPNVFVALAESLSGQNEKCKTCNGSGKCQTCNGRGYFNS